MKFGLFSKSAKAVLCARLAWHEDQRGEIANDAAHHIDTSRIEQRRLPEFVRGDAKQHRNDGRAADQDPTPQDGTAIV